MGDWDYEDRTIRYDCNWRRSGWFVCGNRSRKKGLKPIVFDENAKLGGQLFKVPCGILFPVIGIVGTAYMILNISSDPQERMNIWLLTGACFIVLGIYSAVWIIFKMKMKVFNSIPLEKVMAMENELYYYVRKSKGIWK